MVIDKLSCTNLLEVLDQRAQQSPSEIAFQFLSDNSEPIDESHIARLSYRDLQQKALAVARRLVVEEGLEKGDRALLAYPASLDFVTSFFGCLYAGVIPVSAPIPKVHQNLDRWNHVVKDARIRGVLSVEGLASPLRQLLIKSDATQVRCVFTDDTTVSVPTRGSNVHVHAATNGNDVAFIQYTSGSTSQPKGVVITHGNILVNLRQIERGFGLNQDDFYVSWLPHYHDMGLIGAILSPVYTGFGVALMAPAVFLRNPIRWLEAITYFQATGSGAPNFAYDYCVKRADKKRLAGLNLSTIKRLVNGAELVRQRTMENFYKAFASCGLPQDTFSPCFGLAEATLFISATKTGESLTQLLVESDSLRQMDQPVKVVSKTEEGIAEESKDILKKPSCSVLMSCGWTAPDISLKIVNPLTGTEQNDLQVGEIWVSGENIANGYWQREKDSTESFQAKLTNNDKSYFRTGDLGLLNQKELFITGRLKELIVVRGENYYPQDIELIAFSAHTDLVENGAAAFSVECDSEERLGVMLEVERTALRRLNADQLVDEVRAAVADGCGLQLAEITLLKPGRLPRTPSGKVQRTACKRMAQERSLDCIVRWPLVSNSANKASIKPCLNKESIKTVLDSTLPLRRFSVLSRNIQEKINLYMSLPSGQFPDVTTRFFNMGMDSVTLTQLQHYLEEQVDKTLPTSLFFEYSNIELLTHYLLDDVLYPILTESHLEKTQDEIQFRRDGAKANSQNSFAAAIPSNLQTKMKEELDQLTNLLD